MRRRETHDERLLLRSIAGADCSFNGDCCRRVVSKGSAPALPGGIPTWGFYTIYPSSPGVCCNGCDDMGRLADESPLLSARHAEAGRVAGRVALRAPVAFAKAPPGRGRACDAKSKCDARLQCVDRGGLAKATCELVCSAKTKCPEDERCVIDGNSYVCRPINDGSGL